MTLPQIARNLGLSRHAIGKRLKRGWSMAQATGQEPPPVTKTGPKTSLSKVPGYGRRVQEARRSRARALGLCVACIDEPPRPGLATCQTCADVARVKREISER